MCSVISLMACLLSLPHGSADRNSQPLYDLLGRRRRSLTGARIETDKGLAGKDDRLSLPHGSADRNAQLGEDMHRQRTSLPHGSADRNSPKAASASSTSWSLPHGSADRNTEDDSRVEAAMVAPSRERGSKLTAWDGRGARSESLPHGSADRNTLPPRRAALGSCRSLTGARIETPTSTSPRPSAPVAPSRERGSKPPHHPRGQSRLRSLPHGSADRNNRAMSAPVTASVAPSRERGSKLPAPHPHWSERSSLPHGSADRNQWGYLEGYTAPRRSLTGARIETNSSSGRRSTAWSLPHGSADRNNREKLGPAIDNVAPSRERGSKLARQQVGLAGARSLPHGSADRNST